MAAQRQVRDTFEAAVKPRLLREISMMPDDLPRPAFLSIEGDSERTVEKLARKTIVEGAQRISAAQRTENGGLRRTRFFLTQAQRQRLGDLLGACRA